jgi:hypothetical protein
VHTLTAAAPVTHLSIDKVSKVLQPLLVRRSLKGRPDLANHNGEAPAIVTCEKQSYLNIQLLLDGTEQQSLPLQPIGTACLLYIHMEIQAISA